MLPLQSWRNDVYRSRGNSKIYREQKFNIYLENNINIYTYRTISKFVWIRWNETLDQMLDKYNTWNDWRLLWNLIYLYNICHIKRYKCAYCCDNCITYLLLYIMQNFCQSQKAHLVYIETNQENKFIEDHLHYLWRKYIIIRECSTRVVQYIMRLCSQLLRLIQYNVNL